jgi:hypothetical protein
LIACIRGVGELTGIKFSAWSEDGSKMLSGGVHGMVTGVHVMVTEGFSLICSKMRM